MKRRRIVVIFMLGIVCMFAPSAAETVDFYATKSSSKNTNMLTMITNIYYDQFKTIDGYTLIDRRNSTYSKAQADRSHISFYAEIQEAANASWNCTITAIQESSGKSATNTKQYASQYKILMDARDSLMQVLSELTASPSVGAQSSSSATVTLDDLIGTWYEGQSKIVIMRNGQGFAVLPNGTTLAIHVSVSGGQITAKPTVSTTDVQSWTLTKADARTLKGKKSTSAGTSDSEWKKR